MSEGGPSANGEQAPDTRPLAGPSPLARVQLSDSPDKASASEHADDTKASTLAISLSSDHEKKPSGSGGGGDSTNDEKSSATVINNNNGRSNNKSTTKPTKPSSMSSRKSSKAGFWKSLVNVLLPCVGTGASARATFDDDDATLPRKLSSKKRPKDTTQMTELTTNTNKPTTTATTNTNTTTTTTTANTNTGSTTRRKASGAKVATPTKDSTTTTPTTPVPDANGEKPADASKHMHDPSSTSTYHTAVHTSPQIETATIVPPPHVVPANIETAFDDPDHIPPEVPITSHAAEAVTSAAVQPPGSTGDEPEASDAGSSLMDDESEMDAFEEDEADRLIRNGGAGIPIGPDGKPKPLLATLLPAHKGRKCLVLDLDETLVHSSMKYVAQADYVVPVEIEDQWYNFYVLKRPGVDEFLREMGKIYEVVVFTASLSKYADPVLDHLDVHGVVTHRLFRESCYNHRGNYVKDLSQLGRPIRDTIILDNSPASYIFHPKNAAPVSSWFNDPHDRELMDLSPFLADLAHVDDVRGILDVYI